MNETEIRAKIWAHVTDIGICMVVSRDGDWVRARPMRGVARPERNEIWFVTSKETSIGAEVADDPRCCLTYSDTRSQAYVSLSGQLSIVPDRHILAELWDEATDAYFSNGPDDADIVLLRFTPEIAQYWEAPSSPILLTISFLKAKIDGTRPTLGSSGAVAF